MEIILKLIIINIKINYIILYGIILNISITVSILSEIRVDFATVLASVIYLTQINIDARLISSWSALKLLARIVRGLKKR